MHISNRLRLLNIHELTCSYKVLESKRGVGGGGLTMSYCHQEEALLPPTIHYKLSNRELLMTFNGEFMEKPDTENSGNISNSYVITCAEERSNRMSRNLIEPGCH